MSGFSAHSDSLETPNKDRQRFVDGFFLIKKWHSKPFKFGCRTLKGAKGCQTAKPNLEQDKKKIQDQGTNLAKKLRKCLERLIFTRLNDIWLNEMALKEFLSKLTTKKANIKRLVT